MNLLICFDIDGNLADMKWRNNLAGKEPSRKNWKEYKKWLRKIQSKKTLLKDRSVPGMKELACILKEYAVYLTGRQEIYRKVTKLWLKKNNYPMLPLYLRPKGNRQSAGDYKEKVILDILHKNKTFKHVIIYDDDQDGSIALAATKHGWTMFKNLSGS